MDKQEIKYYNTIGWCGLFCLIFMILMSIFGNAYPDMIGMNSSYATNQCAYIKQTTGIYDLNITMACYGGLSYGYSFIVGGIAVWGFGNSPTWLLQLITLHEVGHQLGMKEIEANEYALNMMGINK